MDPPRTKPNRGKKQKAGKRRVPRTDPYHHPTYPAFPVEPLPHRSTALYSPKSSFDELNLSDAECPAINGELEDSDDDYTLVKRLYKGPRRCRCCVNWVKNPLQTASASKYQEAQSKHAVTARYASQRKDLTLTTSLHSVTVHSQPLKDMLGKVLQEYPGINIGRGDASFYPSFEPLVHGWDELKSCISELKGEAREHGGAFCNIIEPEIGETIKDRDDLLSRGLMTYDLLWTLYK